MALEIFRRKEQKYLITLWQYEQLIEQMGDRVRNDKNGVNGRYTVSSLYFDNQDKDIYFETKNKLKYRQKLRLRVYDEADLNATSFFEIKQKHNKVVNKRRLLMPLNEAYEYLEPNHNPDLAAYDTTNHQVLREIDYFKKVYHLEPEMIVSYRRHAVHGADNDDLRLTFDFDLKCRKDDLRLDHGAYGEHFIDPNLVVLEVKVEHSVPLWLARLLQGLDCEQRSASKFCTSTELLAGGTLPGTTGQPLTSKEMTTIGGIHHGSNHRLICS